MVRHLERCGRLAVRAVCLAALLTFSAAVDARSAREVERLEELGRIWVYVDLFDPYLATSDADWDQALYDAIGQVRGARDEASYLVALNAMLRRSGDPIAEAIPDDRPNEPEDGVSPAIRNERGTWIANCNGLVRAVTGKGATGADLAGQIAAHPTVVDCRAFRGDYAVLHEVMGAIGASRTARALPGGFSLVREYSGFPPATGTSTAGYTSGLSFVDLGQLKPSAQPPATTPLVFLVDGDIAPFEIATIGALQAAGGARVVASGRFGVGITFAHAGRLNLGISEGVYVYPNGTVGFRADAAPPADKALETAIAQLSEGPSAAADGVGALRRRAPGHQYVSEGVPPLEQRLLALFRYWGTIKYFYPYKNLMERPWDDTLREFIPIFMAADTRQAYEMAILRLGVRMQDSHTSVSGLTATLDGIAPSNPAILARFIEGRLAVVALYDVTLADRLGVGDEIVAVDGAPIADLERRLAPLLSASTPQALRARLARRLLSGPRGGVAELQVRGAGGGIRTVRVARTDARPPAPPGPAWRKLESDVGYINLEQLRFEDGDRALDDLINCKSLVVDLRGYPQGTAWVLGPRFARSDAPIFFARFRRPLFQGPPRYGADQSAWQSFEQTVPAAKKGRYEGRIFVLIDERAISQAEHTALFFKAAAADLTFVGSPTNGTDGDVTQVALPGGLGVFFTGHDVRHANGAQLQRVGIQPDVPVSPTLAGLRAGRDEVLEKALELARPATGR
ncbi:MAG: hypothetical protein K8S25_08900 [Alphaproteobacteria bacterium]|nr:hypothetical protein [Alphaproteobacteria bacterium]